MNEINLWLEDVDIFDSIRKLSKYIVAYNQSELDSSFDYMRQSLNQAKSESGATADLKQSFVLILRDSGTNCRSVFDLLDETSSTFYQLKDYFDLQNLQTFYVEITSTENGKTTGDIIEINGAALCNEFDFYFGRHGKNDIDSISKLWMLQEWQKSLDKRNYYTDLSFYTKIRRYIFIQDQAEEVKRLAICDEDAQHSGRSEYCGNGGSDLLIICDPVFSKLINVYDDLGDFMNALPFESAQATLVRNGHGFDVAVTISRDDLNKYAELHPDKERVYVSDIF